MEAISESGEGLRKILELVEGRTGLRVESSNLNRLKIFRYLHSGALFILAVLILVEPTRALRSDQRASANMSEQVPLQDMIYVDLSLKLPESYSLLNSNVMHTESISITSNFSTPLTNTTYLSIYIFMKPSEIVAKAYYLNGTKDIQPFLLYIGLETIPRFYFEAGLIGFDIMIQGHLDGISLIWRNVVDFKGVWLQFSTYMPISYVIVIQAPKGVEVASIYSPDFERSYIKEEASEVGKTYTVPFPASMTIYYRPASWSIIALTLTLLLIFVIALSPYYVNRIHLKAFERISIHIFDVLKIVRSGLSSDKIFTSFILCSLLMVSLGLTAGPDPRIKIYAIATPNTASLLETSLKSSLGQVQVISPQQTSSEFETMANLGVIEAFLISDYPSIALDPIKKYFLDPLQQVPLIIIDESTSDPDFSRVVKDRYGGKIILIKNIYDISQASIINTLRGLQRQNTLGLNSNIEIFKVASRIVALLSFLEAFLALAFLSSRLIETGRVKGMGSFPEAIALSAFVFFFTQAIYMVTSVLLNMPIGLHAVSSGSTEITVVGFLGFGGGSSPRAVAGLLGLLTGAFITMKSSEVDRYGFLAFLLLILLLAVEPFTGGVFFYDSLLFFMSGPRLESIQTSIIYTKDIFSTIGDVFGGWVSDLYGLSTGEIFFYAGAVPIFLFANLKRSTATVLLLFSCFAAGNGFIRTAEMTPFKTFASLIPGLMMGTFLVIVFVLFSSLETQLRNKLGK